MNILQIYKDSDIYNFKTQLQFPVPDRPVPLHINIGVTPREVRLEIYKSDKKSLLDYINPANPFAETLIQNILDFQNKKQIGNDKLFQQVAVITSEGNPEIASNAAQQNPTKVQSSFSS